MILNLYYPIFALYYLGFGVLSCSLPKQNKSINIKERDLSKYLKMYISYKDHFFSFSFFFFITKSASVKGPRCLGVGHLGSDFYVDFPLWVIIVGLPN